MRVAAGVLAVFLAAQSAAFVAAEGSALAKSRGKRAKKKPKPTPAANSRADGRDHLKKANALAAKDACELAIEEYTLAFDRLNDPEILLPRAECRRRVGQAAEAVADYKAYLEVTPDVRNRADIESKIAALEGGSSPNAPPIEKPSVPPPVAERKPPPAAERKPPPVAERKPPPPPITPPASNTPPPPPAVFEPPPSPPVTVEEPITPPATPPVASELGQTRRPAADLEARPAESKGHFWLWTIVAVVVAGGAAAAGYWYLRPVDEPPPGTQLGNYRF